MARCLDKIIPPSTDDLYQ